MQNPFRYFNSSPEVFRLAVMLYIRYPLSLRQVEDLLFERGIDICHESIRFWWNRFGPMFAAEIRRRRVHHTGIVTLTESGQQRTASTPIQVAALALSHTSKASVRNLLKVGLLSK